MLGFELGYIELLGVDETNLDDWARGASSPRTSWRSR
jgi:hypothetical protein